MKIYKNHCLHVSYKAFKSCTSIIAICSFICIISLTCTSISEAKKLQPPNNLKIAQKHAAVFMLKTKQNQPDMAQRILKPGKEGKIVPIPNQKTYQLGQKVRLVAVPEPGYAFQGWQGSGTGKMNPQTITSEQETYVRAEFAPRKENETLYVDAAADLPGDGSAARPFPSIQAALYTAQPGQTILIHQGTYREALSTRRGGNAQEGPITLLALNNEQVKIENKGRMLTVNHPHIIISGLEFDAQFSTTNGAIRVKQGAENLLLQDITLKNNARHGVNISYADQVSILDSLIHSCLWFEDADQEGQQFKRIDAHGIVAVGVEGLMVAGTEIRDVSGDAIQLAYQNWDDVLLDQVKFWNRPLPAEIADKLGFPDLEGLNPGEDAVDTKARVDEVRGRLNIQNSEFHGWASDFIANAAALNLKHKVSAQVRGCKFYDNNIALRLRGPGSRPGAHVHVEENIFRDNEIHIRAEDRIEELKIFDNRFHAQEGTVLQLAPSRRGIGAGFEAENNQVIGAENPFEALLQ